MDKPLSPAAQAVLDGFRAVPSLMDGPSIAGALRAAAVYCTRDRIQLIAIAEELESTHGD
jgi:hypothetical protein